MIRKIRFIIKSPYTVILGFMLIQSIALICVSWPYFLDWLHQLLYGKMCFSHIAEQYPSFYLENKVPFSEFFVGEDSSSYIISFLATIAAIDGILLTLGIQLSQDRLLQIRNFYNSEVMNNILDKDKLLKYFHWWVILHLVYTLFLFFFNEKNSLFFILSTLLIFETVLISVYFMIKYFQRLRQYEEFKNLNIKNPYLKRLKSKWYKDNKSYTELGLLLKDIVIAITQKKDPTDKRVERYLKHLSTMYIKVSKNLNKENYYEQFTVPHNNGFVSYLHKNVLNHFVTIYEKTLSLNEIWLHFIFHYFLTQILKKSFNTDILKNHQENFNDVMEVIQMLTINGVQSYNNMNTLSKKQILTFMFHWYFNTLNTEKYFQLVF